MPALWETACPLKEAWKNLPDNRYSAGEWHRMNAGATTALLDFVEPVLCDT